MSRLALLVKEWQVLLAALVAVAAAWGFVELASEVVEGGTTELDTALFLALREPGNPVEALGPPWLEKIARDLTALGSFAVLAVVTLATAGYLFLGTKHRAAVAVLFSVVGGVLLSNLLKFAFDRPRPMLVPHADIVTSASFPSGHSMMAAVTYLTLGALLAQTHREIGMKIYLLVLALGMAVMVGVTRVYLGVHWPSDVLGGWTVGTAWALACSVGFYWLQRRGTIEAPS